MRLGEAALVDSGAWIALALSRDPQHVRARERWDMLHAVDATSFAIMKRARIRLAFTFDYHFAMVGYRLVG